MKKVTSDLLINPADFYSMADSNLLNLLSWVLADANMLRRTKSLPELESFAHDFEPLGVAASNRDKTSLFAKKDWFLIHWPTVVRCVDMMFELQQFGMVAVLWHFREVLRRRSLVYYDLLRRKIAQQLTYRYYPMSEEDKIQKGYRDLSPVEEEVFEGLANGVIRTDKTVKALSQSFKDTLTPRGTHKSLRSMLFARKPVREDIFEVIGPYKPEDCTIFSATELRRNSRMIQANRAISLVYTDGFGPATLGDDFREIFYAFHFRRVDHGVAKLSNHVLAVDLIKYIPYRTQLTNYYRNMVGPQKYQSKALTAAAMLKYFEAVFEPLVVHGAASVYRRRIEQLWGDDSLEHVLFLSVDGIARRLSAANKMEVVRSHKSKQQSYVPAGSKVPRIYVLESPALPDRDYVTLRFETIRRPSGLFWGVPWEVPASLHYDIPTTSKLCMTDTRADLPRKTTMKKGVTYVEAYDRYFYTLDFLLECAELDDNPARDSGELRGWMKMLSEMPTKQFNLLQAGTKKDLVVQQKRKPGRTLRGVSWTKEEDDAIKELYRPDMTESDEARLLRICRGRNTRALMRRATQLRNAMIEDGIYDLELLPHRHYNASLQKLVKDHKAKAQRRIRERVVKL